MNVFVTGPTGWIGSAVVDQLLATGHQVTDLARSDASAAMLEAKGVAVHRGELDDPASLRSGAHSADAVVHLAFKHNFADLAASNIAERNAVQALCETLVGSGRPLLLASGLAFLTPGHHVAEDQSSTAHGVESLRGGAENLALDWAGRGVNTIITRLPPSVHGDGDPWFTAALVQTARAHGVSAYIDDGANRWSAIHRGDAARIVQLALDTPAPAGSILHAAAEDGVPTREIAEAIGRGLELPVASVPAAMAPDRFGWLAMFFGLDVAASNDATRKLLDWTPSGPPDRGPRRRLLLPLTPNTEQQAPRKSHDTASLDVPSGTSIDAPARRRPAPAPAPAV